jgi:phosphoribosylamine--glycine ligase
VIEFNVRFGDPEAQVVLPRVESDLPELLIAAAEGSVSGRTVRTSDDIAVGVVLASAGYPASVVTGVPITGLPEAVQTPGVDVYHAATALSGGKLVTAGGRVLTVVGRGATFEDAIARAYDGVGRIAFDGMQCRRDIGLKALRGR